MDHTEALNLILANACVHKREDGGMVTFILDLHCATAEVLAKPRVQQSLTYDIINVEIKRG